jgi:hypothetical protein
MRNQPSPRKSAKGPKPFKFKKKGHKNGFNGAPQNGNTWNAVPSSAAVCQKCGQPAPDGKLCTFHRNLLNSLRNGFRTM